MKFHFSLTAVVQYIATNILCLTKEVHFTYTTSNGISIMILVTFEEKCIRRVTSVIAPLKRKENS
jgi:hypothetical protein